MVSRNNTIIAIDGYSSCGKSTLAKALAKQLGYVYVDSGAMYRAVTLFFLRHKIDLEDDAAVEQAVSQIQIDMHEEQGALAIQLNGEDVSDEIRQMYVSELVSEVSALKRVRQEMVAQQQALGRRRNLVMDGRDIGTHVFPHADLKLFMTADPAVRAQRRFLELQAKGEQTSMEEVIENLAHRDQIDTTRDESPLVQADDAILLDNTHLSEAEQLAFALAEVAKIR
ncbi:MAG TPA: (d)CMP kinase [Sphingobacteriaceae bacterium]|nr:(d)CMP kinase [Sphingobacteriaceae bacterium]